MCRITSVSGRSTDQPRVSLGLVSQQHQRFFGVLPSCVVTKRTRVSSRLFFFFFVPRLFKTKNSKNRAHVQGAVRFCTGGPHTS